MFYFQNGKANKNGDSLSVAVNVAQYSVIWAIAKRDESPGTGREHPPPPTPFRRHARNVQTHTPIPNAIPAWKTMRVVT